MTGAGLDKGGHVQGVSPRVKMSFKAQLPPLSDGTGREEEGGGDNSNNGTITRRASTNDMPRGGYAKYTND